MRAGNLLINLAAAFLLSVTAAHAAAPGKGALPDVKPGQAQIVIMRSTTVNALVGALLFDVTSGEPKLLGKITNNRKLVLDVPPGDYVFMVGPMGLFDFMRASVSADQRYFAIVAPIWPANYILRPVRHQDSPFLYSSTDFDRILKKTKLADPYSETFDEDKTRKLGEFYRVRWEKWQTKSAEEKQALTIRPEDSWSESAPAG
jgi:hypothetical protein